MKNLYIRHGYVSDLDTDTMRVKVKLEELGDDFVTHWLPVAMMATQDDKSYDHIDINTFVCCIVDDKCENGIVIGGIYTDDNKTDGAGTDLMGRKFKDGTRVQYDRSAHKASIDNDTHDVKIEINGGGKGTVPYSQNTVDKINRLEQALTDLAIYVGSLPIPVSGSVSIAPNPAATQTFQITQQTVVSDIEDKNFKH